MFLAQRVPFGGKTGEAPEHLCFRKSTRLEVERLGEWPGGHPPPPPPTPAGPRRSAAKQAGFPPPAPQVGRSRMPAAEFNENMILHFYKARVVDVSSRKKKHTYTQSPTTPPCPPKKEKKKIIQNYVWAFLFVGEIFYKEPVLFPSKMALP